MTSYEQITVRGALVEAPLNPCPWCKKTPDLRMPLDQKGAKEDETWVWKIRCINNSCRVSSETYVSIRKTTKTNLSRFLDKLDNLFDKWNQGNAIKAYEKKVLDLRMIPNLGIK